MERTMNWRNWESYGFIRDIDGGDFSVAFQYFQEEYSESVSAEYSDYDILLRSAPIKAFVRSSGRTMTVNLVFTVSDGQNQFVGYNNTLGKVRKLQALAYPDYNGTIRPHRVWLKIGSFIDWTAVITNVDVNYKAPFNSVDGELLPQIIEASVQLQEVYTNFLHVKDGYDIAGKYVTITSETPQSIS